MISNKPCIAISLRIVKAQNYDETRDALSHDWPQFLENLGIIPIYIPNNLLNVKNYLSTFEIDGLILIQPTSPFRKIKSIKKAIRIYKKDMNKSVVSFSPTNKKRINKTHFAFHLCLSYAIHKINFTWKV